jgi:protein-disulfide isomerase-like protein with CxxC motif
VRRPCPDEPSLGRRSAPHGADFGFREPLTPHLARPGSRRVPPRSTTTIALTDVIEAILYTDPGCPWAYSANPALRVLEWRYREQLSWRLVVIGLREEASDAAVRAFDPQRALARYRVYEQRYGMPFGSRPKKRPAGTGRGCRAVVAAGLLDPGSEWVALRALQLANFTTTLYLDDAESIREVLASVDGIDADRVVDRIDDDDVTREYERQRAEARSAEGSAAHAQRKTSSSGGSVRYTAPSLVLRAGDRTMTAGGWQPLLAYDVLLANLDPALRRVPPAESPERLLEFFPSGLTTAEVALLLADGPDPVGDLADAERMLSELADAGGATQTEPGEIPVWIRTSARDE